MQLGFLGQCFLFLAERLLLVILNERSEEGSGQAQHEWMLVSFKSCTPRFLDRFAPTE